MTFGVFAQPGANVVVLGRFPLGWILSLPNTTPMHSSFLTSFKRRHSSNVFCSSCNSLERIWCLNVLLFSLATQLFKAINCLLYVKNKRWWLFHSESKRVSWAPAFSYLETILSDLLLRCCCCCGWARDETSATGQPLHDVGRGVVVVVVHAG